ncbi:hypothetical protein [Mesorhizobium sanjuanii]|uniref:hypothetical protein n=1 Tax=Mesorhizobium sanjuanii TaxID=2037900 RepID=UPI001AD84F88|nr:hypothetical protein [Mesorhizobium sanjuanii]
MTNAVAAMGAPIGRLFLPPVGGNIEITAAFSKDPCVCFCKYGGTQASAFLASVNT